MLLSCTIGTLLIAFIEPLTDNTAETSANPASILDDNHSAFSFYNPGQTPLGYDMSEFMVASDLDFLNNFSNRGFY